MARRRRQRLEPATGDDMARIVSAHRAGQARLRAIASSTIGAAWYSLGSYDRADVDRFVSLVAPVSEAVQRQSVSITEAFIARAIGAAPLGLNREAIVTATRAGAEASEVYARPFVTTWTSLGNGTPYEAAVKAGAERASSAAATDVQVAMRDTLLAAGEGYDDLTGYQRVAGGDACSFCLAVNGAQFQTDDPMPLHNNCGCGVEPIVYTRITKQEFPEGEVAVADHGELGPVLVDPAQNFTGAGDLAHAH